MSNQDTNEFLSRFNASTFVFQSKDDGKGTKDAALIEKFGKVWHKASAYNSKVEKWLRGNNSDGWGCFFAVNKLDQSLDPKHKRTEKMLTGIRAVWVEDDERRDVPRTDWPLKPSIIVNSSPGKYHYYWLTNLEISDLNKSDLNKSEWTGVMQTMVDNYGCDNNAKDLVRVLRLPGFYHMKNPDEPHMVTFTGNGEPYDWDMITKAFPPSHSNTTKTSTHDGNCNNSDGKDVAGLIDDYEGGHRHGPSSRMAMKLANYNLPKDEIISILANLFPENNLSHHTQSASSAVEKVKAEKKEKDGPALRVTPTDIQGYIPPLQYVVNGILPRGVASMLGGHGGSGKSQLALIIAAHVACGREWAGMLIVQDKVLFVTLEDPADIIRLRLYKIAAAYSLNPDVINENVTIVDGSDGVTLASESSRAGIRALELSAAHESIGKMAAGFGLVIIDNASDAFSANENDRMLVRRFIHSLAKIARDNEAAVLLLAHIDKASAKYGSAGNSYSGSTAWHNSVRSRLALVDRDGLKLVHEKANLGRRIEPILLTWSDDGVLMVGAGDSSASDDDDAENVLAAIKAAIRDGVNVSTAESGPSNTLLVLSKIPELPDELKDKTGKKRFWSALTRLNRSGKIEKDQYTNASRNHRERWVCGRESG